MMIHMLATVILFWVRVPVVSEQMTLVEPRVYTPYRQVRHQTVLGSHPFYNQYEGTVTVIKRSRGH